MPNKERTIIPIFNPGSLDNAKGFCEKCEKELKRLPIAFSACKEHPQARAVVLNPGPTMFTGVAQCL